MKGGAGKRRATKRTQTYLALDLSPQTRLVGNHAVDPPPGTLAHLLLAIDRPRAHGLAGGLAFGEECLAGGRAKRGEVHGIAVHGRPKVGTRVRGRHRDGVAGQEREVGHGGLDELGLGVSHLCLQSLSACEARGAK